LGLRLLRVGNAPAHLLLVVSCIALAGFLHTVLPISCKFVGSRKYPQTFGMVPSAKLGFPVWGLTRCVRARGNTLATKGASRHGNSMSCFIR
jgi:hypothetical protein